jgi:tRNA threonylcarbamoyladenosine modification (KEOPS) complex  Pcc1 subunit
MGMKKILVLFCVFVLFACNHTDDDRRDLSSVFLPTILSTDGEVLTLTFDAQSRIVQLGEVANNSEFARLYTFNYSEGKLVSAEAIYFSVVVEGGYNYVESFGFQYDEGRVVVEKEFKDSSGFETTTNSVLYIDDNENLLRTDGVEISYDQRGNMVKVIDNGNVTEVTYDNMKGSFVNVKTPQWALYYIMKLGNFYRVNNPVQVKGYPVDMGSEVLVKRDFEYNQYGFPVRFVQQTTESNGEIYTDNFYIDYLRLYKD